ncbi:MAG: FAD-dependent oxidoreductase [Chloroflexi bacterium]|nr:FAD-dependent oxidoreductase [Chloroflexota bacterium]
MEQHLETDVLVVGYGGAGATAAITAHDHGARVTILEKMPAGGGNTLASANSILMPKGMGAADYFEALCGGATDRDIIETFIRGGLDLENWLRQMGAEIEPHYPPKEVIFPGVGLPSWPRAPGGDLISRIYIKWNPRDHGRNPRSLWEFLADHVERRGITVKTGARAKEIIAEDGKITGVVADSKGQRMSIRAKRGVILACGGFEYSEEMKRTFLPCGQLYCFGPPGNTGDGILMAQRVGAALWHMTSLFGPLAFKSPEYEAGFGIKLPGERFIFVDRDGKRFTDETALKIHDMWRAVAGWDPERQRYPRIPCYSVFDEVTRKRAPLFRQTGANQSYQWSSDNSEEIGKGWIARGQTIGEMARRIPVDETVLESTVSRYNRCCQTGIDADFGRPRVYLGPIDTPPFYAITLWPGLMSTHGGPKRDKEARVLDNDGKPIPRLYSAGEMGGLSSLQYEAGTDLCECLVFGRIAGQNAAAEGSRQ